MTKRKKKRIVKDIFKKIINIRPEITLKKINTGSKDSLPYIRFSWRDWIFEAFLDGRGLHIYGDYNPVVKLFERHLSRYESTINVSDEVSLGEALDYISANETQARANAIKGRHLKRWCVGGEEVEIMERFNRCVIDREAKLKYAHFRVKFLCATISHLLAEKVDFTFVDNEYTIVVKNPTKRFDPNAYDKFLRRLLKNKNMHSIVCTNRERTYQKYMNRRDAND